MPLPRVLIVLVNWKRAIDTCACVSSLLGINGISWCAVICENGSPDDSASYLKKFLRERFSENVRVGKGGQQIYDYTDIGGKDNLAPKISLVLSENNCGFAGGNNIAFDCASDEFVPEYVWFLNNDTEVGADALLQMVTRITESPQIGICGSTLIYAYDRETVQCLGGASYSKWTGAVREIGNQNSRHFPVDRDIVETQLDYVSGASMLVTKRFLDDVGLMSEDYFLYYEEIDWAVRARKAGYRLGYAPKAIVYHKEGAALGSGKSGARSLLAEYYGVRNRLVFTRKFFPWALPTVFLFSAMQVVRRCLQGRWSHARLMTAVLLGLQRTAPGVKAT